MSEENEPQEIADEMLDGVNGAATRHIDGYGIFALTLDEQIALERSNGVGGERDEPNHDPIAEPMPKGQGWPFGPSKLPECSKS